MFAFVRCPRCPEPLARGQAGQRTSRREPHGFAVSFHHLLLSSEYSAIGRAFIAVYRVLAEKPANPDYS